MILGKTFSTGEQKLERRRSRADHGGGATGLEHGPVGRTHLPGPRRGPAPEQTPRSGHAWPRLRRR